jgi:hypothetical protein
MARSQPYAALILMPLFAGFALVAAQSLPSSGVESTPIVPSRITANCVIFQSVQNSDRRIQYAGIRNTSFTSTGA